MSMPQPHKTMGCQQLLRSGYEHSGWLRTRSKLHTLSPNITSMLLNWNSKYVVLAEGCLYRFTTETDRSPSGCFSLFGYQQITRASDVRQSEAPWPFKMEHIGGSEKAYYFSASSEAEMVKWMQSIKKQMLWVNSQIGMSIKRDRSDSDDSLSLIEESIYDDAENVKNQLSQLRLEDQEIDDPDDYTTIEETERSLNHRPLPPTPTALLSAPGFPLTHDSVPDVPAPRPPMPRPLPKANNVTAPQGLSVMLAKGNQNQPLVTNRGLGPPIPLPRKSDSDAPVRDVKTAATPPKPLSLSKAAFWEGTDREEANQIVSKHMTDGVYLIRGSEQNNKVLVVYANNMARKYKLNVLVDGKLSICKTDTFFSLDKLLEYYHNHKLPNHDTELTFPYSKYK